MLHRRRGKDRYTRFYCEKNKSFRSIWMVYSTTTLKGTANGRVKMIRLKIQINVILKPLASYSSYAHTEMFPLQNICFPQWNLTHVFPGKHCERLVLIYSYNLELASKLCRLWFILMAASFCIFMLFSHSVCVWNNSAWQSFPRLLTLSLHLVHFPHSLPFYYHFHFLSLNSFH